MSLRSLRDRLRQRRIPGVTAQAPLNPEAIFDAGPTESSAPAPLEREFADRLAAIAAELPELHASLARLDPQQQRAVLSPDRRLLVRAQVGSGKTTVLVHRVLWLHEVEGLPLDRIAILTFTNKAAEEMKSRIRELGRDLAPSFEDFWLTGTFHGVSRALLARALPVQQLERTPRFRIVDARERRRLMDEIIDREGLTIRYRNRLDRRLERLATGRTRFGVMKHDDDIRRLVSLYEVEKRRLDLMDFDDLVDGARQLSNELPAERRPLAVVVDELQDCDDSQLDLIEGLVGDATESAIFAVGDPQQVIYSWRGGRIGVFDEFARRFDCRELALPCNYRNTGSILEAARSVLTHGGVGDLHATRERGPKLRVLRHHNPLQEGLYLVQRIAESEDEGRSLDEIAILFRTRDQAAPLRDALGRADIPYREPNQTSLREHPILLFLRDLLRAAAGQGDAATFLRILRHEDFGFPLLRRRIPKSARFAGPAEIRARISDDLSADARLDDALGFLDRLVSIGDAGISTAEEVVAALELEPLLRPASSGFEDHLALMLRGLELGLEETAGSKLTTRDRFAACADTLTLGTLGAGLGGGTDHGERGAVALLTLHAAKGLEFEQVFISGANLGLCPLTASRRSPESEQEERRLFFVGLTRARDEVEISWLTEPQRFSAQPEPSPYLDLFPPQLVDRLDRSVPEFEPTPTRSPGASVWRVGQAVRHRQYGTGEVFRVADGFVSCRFRKIGEKSFAESLCPLETMDSPS